MSKNGIGDKAAKKSRKADQDQTKTSEIVVERKRKSTSEEAERSPLRVAAPVSVAVAPSAPVAVVALEAVSPINIPIPKKEVNFRNHFPEGDLKCRPGTEFSDDDDDESIDIKEIDTSLVKEKNASYFEQLGNEAVQGEDCPFFSNLIWPNCSKLNFGLD